MATYQPVRAGLDILLKDLLKLFGGSSFVAQGRPYGNYSGNFSSTISENSPIISNPYGVTSKVDLGQESFVYGQKSIDLQPGQSYNFLTGQLSDPKLHAQTAQRLNEALQYRVVNEAGLSQATKSTAREQPGVLATLDQLYFGNTSTKAETSFAKSNFALAAEQGLNTSGTKSILGTDAVKSAATTTALKRALT